MVPQVVSVYWLIPLVLCLLVACIQLVRQHKHLKSYQSFNVRHLKTHRKVMLKTGGVEIFAEGIRYKQQRFFFMNQENVVASFPIKEGEFETFEQFFSANGIAVKIS